jgi:hypothetical protein
MITAALLLTVIAAVRYRTFRWVAAVLLGMAFVQAHPVWTAVAAVLAGACYVVVRQRRRSREARIAQGVHDDCLRERCEEQDRQVRAGDPAGFYGLYPPTAGA